MTVVDDFISAWTGRTLEEVLAGIDLDDALDMRDSVGFDTAWLAAKVRILPVGEDRLRGLSDEEEQRVFSFMYASGMGGEIVEHVVEDLNLISTADRLGVVDPWVEVLRKCYRRGVLPVSVVP
jgi:hypothetical protein